MVHQFASALPSPSAAFSFVLHSIALSSRLACRERAPPAGKRSSTGQPANRAVEHRRPRSTVGPLSLLTYTMEDRNIQERSEMAST
ncbi:hypothetical protein BD309DRAFT_147157 [Dichomitus squalens]|uniref:Uncharacterized protein n=1 Tax=Dichomitus squalens TaxID=114155 RepID=A0A4Q9NNF7_9APHY|nr:hypothetical protein BD309DRAFT_147157 [Dichomitus squalens]TBU54142.1 hypothetical protein BD310DRAFT_103384 [Dichomitus squalens]